MKFFLWPFSVFHEFKNSSCLIVINECALRPGKLPYRLDQIKSGQFIDLPLNNIEMSKCRKTQCQHMDQVMRKCIL